MIKQTKLQIAAIENGEAKMVTEEARIEAEGTVVYNMWYLLHQISIFRSRSL